MSTLVCIPVRRIKCQVGIEEVRAWTVVEELLLLAVAQQPMTIAGLAAASGLARQIVVAALARLMRFRLVKVEREHHKFAASRFGVMAVRSGNPLPVIAKARERWLGFVVDRVVGRVLWTRDVRRVTVRDLEGLRRRPGVQRLVMLPEPHQRIDVGQAAMAVRIMELVERGREERLARIVAGSAVEYDEFIGVTVENGELRDLPESAGNSLRKAVLSAAAGRTFALPRAPVARSAPLAGREVSCEFDAEDIVIGGSAQRRLLESVLEGASSRVVIHSTFIKEDTFALLRPAMQAACRREVQINILWGASQTAGSIDDYAMTARRIAALVREDPVLRGRVSVAAQSTGSHAKLVLADRRESGWLGIVSSCNWLKTPFQPVEVSVMLRHPHLVAGIASALQRMAGARGLADALANRLAITGHELLAQHGRSGRARVKLIAGDDHDSLMRQASGAASRRLLIGMHKLGATARPGALLPAETARGRARSVTVLFTHKAGPLKNRHVRELTREAAEYGVRLMEAGTIALHGKLVLWDDDDVVISSLNWGSASADPAFPLGDIGVHICATGVAGDVHRRLTEIYPALTAPWPGSE